MCPEPLAQRENMGPVRVAKDTNLECCPTNPPGYLVTIPAALGLHLAEKLQSFWQLVMLLGHVALFSLICSHKPLLTLIAIVQLQSTTLIWTNAFQHFLFHATLYTHEVWQAASRKQMVLCLCMNIYIYICVCKAICNMYIGMIVYACMLRLILTLDLYIYVIYYRCTVIQNIIYIYIYICMHVQVCMTHWCYFALGSQAAHTPRKASLTQSIQFLLNIWTRNICPLDLGVVRKPLFSILQKRIIYVH